MPPADRALALGWEPLYTHPPQELTKEDIAQNLKSRLDAALLLEERGQEIAQPRREWQGLTEEEIKNAVLGDPFGGAALMSMMRDGVMVAELRQAVERIARAIEQALKEKNNGLL